MVQGGQLTIDAELPAFELGPGRNPLTAMKLSLRGALPFEDLGAVTQFFPALDLKIEGGPGELELNVFLEDGLFADGGFLRAKAKSAGFALPLKTAEFELVGALAAQLDITQQNEENRFNSKLSWEDLTMHRRTPSSNAGNKQVPPQTEKVEALVSLKAIRASTKFSVKRGFQDAALQHADAEVTGLEVKNLSLFNDTLAPLQFRRGILKFDAQVAMQKIDQVRGKSRLRLEGVQLRAGNLGADFSALLQSELQSTLPTQQFAVQPFTLVVRPLTLYLGGDSIAWPFTLSSTNTRYRGTQGEGLSVFSLQGPSLRPVVEALLKKGLIRWAGKVVLGQGPTEAKIRFAQSGPQSRIDLLSFKSGRVAVDGVLALPPTRGAFLLIAPVLRVGFLFNQGKLQTKATASRAWLERQYAALKINKIAHEKTRPGSNKESKKKPKKKKSRVGKN
ncbi:MAG: hypothetical protein MK135_13215 [Polyangiaceae bacterium]|nr:hypothetical protein [Polyangiaceae bacterium]